MGPGGMVPHGTVNISLEVRAIALKKMDRLSKSDPICFLQEPSNPLYMNDRTQWKTIQQTEVIRNSTAPVWTTRLKVPYHFEQYQPLRFSLVDVDNFKTVTGDHLGYADTTLADLVRNPNETIPVHLPRRAGKQGPNTTVGAPFRPGGSAQPSTQAGHLIIRAHDEDAAGRIRVFLQLRAQNIPSLDKVAGITTSKSDPFYRLSVQVPHSIRPVTLYTSEHHDNNSDPIWHAHTSHLPAVNESNDSIMLIVEIFDWNRSKQHALIGTGKFSLADALSKERPFEIVRPNKAPTGGGQGGRMGRKRPPMLFVHDSRARRLPSFVSYLSGGMVLNFVVAVDFTKSNGPANQRSSLHFLGDNPNMFTQTSQYAQALRAVSSVMTPYVGERGAVTALGFGAKVPWAPPHLRGQASFDFHLAGALSPGGFPGPLEVHGVDGLLQAYRASAQSVEMYGPTLFAPVIRRAVHLANLNPISPNRQVFTVLLIMTDGMLDDMSETVDAIVDASYNTPLAIVIVGVGNADFSRMNTLDGDNVKLRSSSGRTAKHDIVQFCKFESNMRLEVLATKVLQEVPGRVVEFMMERGFDPMVHPQQAHMGMGPGGPL